MSDRSSTSTESVVADTAAVDVLSSQTVAAQQKTRRKRSWLERMTVACFSAVLMLGLAFVGLFALLSHGPVELPFLKDRIASALEQRIGGQIDVQVGNVIVEKSSQGMELHIRNIVFKDTKGRDIIKAPDSVVSFDALRLFSLDLVPRTLALKNMSVHAEISKAGEIRLTSASAPLPSASAQPIPATDEKPRLQEAIGFLTAIIFDSGNKGLQSIAITDSSLRLDDLRTNRSTSFDRFNIAFEARDERDGIGNRIPAARVSGDVLRGTHATPFEINLAKHNTGLKLAAIVRNLDYNLVSALAGTSHLPVFFNAAFTAEVDASLTLQGEPASVAARINAGPSLLKFEAATPVEISIDQLKASGNWTAGTDTVSNIRLGVMAQGHTIETTGTLRLPANAQSEFSFEGTGKDWRLAPLAKSDQTVVANADILLKAPAALNSIRIEKLDVSGPQTNINLKGNLDPSGHLRLDLKAGRMPLRTVLRWWPTMISPEAHTYFNQNVVDGTSSQLGIVVDMPRKVLEDALALKPLPDKSVSVDSVFESATLKVVDGLPPLTGLAGNAKLSALQAQGVATRGQIEFRSGRRVPLSEGTFQITKLDTYTPDSVFKFRVQAPLEAVGELLNQPPLKGAFAIKGIPAEARGQLDGRVSVSLPLAKQIKAADIVTDISATMSGVSIDKAIGQEKLDNATLVLSSDKTGMDIKGTGTWQGLPVTIALENDANDKSSAAVIGFNLDEAALKRRGINLGKQLTGTLPVKIRTLQEVGESVKSSVEIDLTRAAIDGLFPGFQKPAGRNARITFDAIEKGAGYSIQNIALDSGASSFRGQAEAQGDGTVTSAKFSLFRLSPGDNVRLDYERQNAAAKITIRGNNFDARPFLKPLSDQGPQASRQEGDLELDLKTTLLSGHGGEVMTNSDLRIVRRQGQIRQLSMTGKINGESVKINGRSTNDSPPPLAVQVDDAGAFLRFMDLYSRMIGGDMVGQLTPVGSRRMDGNFNFKNFTLRNEPAIRRLVSANNPDGSARIGGDAAFTKMRLEFTRTGTENTIKEAVIFGPQIGLTFNGIIDSVRDRISLSGTFIPVYGLNNALAQIPVLGNLLAGGRNEGLLAITFGISGRASQPNVTINPLSAVAPGILRKIFEFRNEATGNLPQPSPAPQN
ncbi:MAG: DUF3971 domain-containing protein [Beijerinckiaceae bacterium]